MARGLKFRIKEVEGLHNLCSENKDADQLCGYHAADLCLCFRIYKKQIFSWHGSLSSPGVVAERRVKDLGAVQRMKSRQFMKMGVKNNSFQFHFRQDAPY